MKTKKPIYRFFSAFLIIAVLLTAVAPAGLQGKALVKKLCTMLSGDQAVVMVMDVCHSSMQASTVEKISGQTVNQEAVEACRAAFNSCYVDDTSASKAAPVSQITSAKVIALPAKNLGQAATSPPLISSVEHSFLHAADSSPPIYLKNSSFLN